jgi:hypothetical protein
MPAGNWSYRSISASSANSAWAVGTTTAIAIYHYDGIAWAEDTSFAASAGGLVADIFALSDSSVWACGEVAGKAVDYERGSIWHFDGEEWLRVFEVVDIPGDGLRSFYFRKITALPDSAVWAMATEFDESAGKHNYHLYHYDGTDWTFEAFPENFTSAIGMDVGGINDLWIVGDPPVPPAHDPCDAMEMGW